MKRVLASIFICIVFLGLLMSVVSCSEKIPEVTISSVDMPSQVEVGNYATATLTFENKEKRAVDVVLIGHSSRAGRFLSESLTLPPSDQISKTYKVNADVIGDLAVTFKISYKDNELDSWQRIIEIIPTPTPSLTVFQYTALTETLVTELKTLMNDNSSYKNLQGEALDSGSISILDYSNNLVDSCNHLTQEISSIKNRWDAIIPPRDFVNFHKCYSDMIAQVIQIFEDAAHCYQIMDFECATVSQQIDEQGVQQTTCYNMLN